MESYTLTSLVTNQYKTQRSDLFLKRSKISTLYIVVIDGAVPIAPAYPEGYLSIDLLSINHLIWSGHHRVFCQCTLNRRFFDLSFAVTSEATTFVASLKGFKDEDLIENIRTPLELDVMSLSWPADRTEAAYLEREPLDSCSLLKDRSLSPAVDSHIATPRVSPSKISLRINFPTTPISPTPSKKFTVGTSSEECHSCGEVLEHIFNTGLYSDLAVIADGRCFKVHKAIVCPRSRFFAKAMSGQFKEAETAIITVADTSEVMEAILQHLYGQEITLNRPLQATPSAGQNDMKRYSVIRHMVDVYLAADKYGIPDLFDIMICAVKERLPWISKPQTLTDVAQYIYTHTPYRDGQVCEMREAIAEFMENHLKAILRDPSGANAMLENQSLMFDILQRSAEVRPTPNKLGASVKRAREETYGEAADQCRRSLRLKQKGVSGG